jgi:HK97 family phage prohead protease
MPTKQATYELVEFKALDTDEATGEFEAIVSVFNNVDAQGDRVLPGAFEKSLASWRAKGSPIPVLWSHDWGNPQAHIGAADPNLVEEVERGLKVRGQIDLDNPFAGQVYKLMKGRRVVQFSFAYDIVKERRAKDGANELVELDIIEVGPTLRGANPDTELLSVKSDLEAAAAKCDKGDDPEDPIPAKSDDDPDQPPAPDAVEPDGEKAGRRISQATESELRTRITTLRAEIDAIESLLPQEESDSEKTAESEASTGNESDDLLKYKTAIAAAMSP